MIDQELKAFIENIPKAELHIHLDSVYPDLSLRAAKRNNVTLPFKSIAEANTWYQFDDLEDFLSKWVVTITALLTEQDYYEVAYDMCKDMKRQNIVRREAMFTYAAAHEGRVDLDVMLSGLTRGRDAGRSEFNVDLFFIADIDRTISGDRSLKYIEDILPYKDSLGIVGVGLDCMETGYPVGPHQQAFELAKKHGLYISAHCGEEYDAGPEGVWDVLDTIKPDRLDHGNQSIRDDRLIKYLAELQIPLTLCPISNVKVKVYRDVSEHPVIALRDKGLFVTVNSDDPAFMQNDLIDNYLQVAEAFDLTQDDIADFARNSFIASYAAEDEKQKYLAMLDEWLAKNKK